MGPNCLQSISADNKSPLAGKELNKKQLVDTSFWLLPRFKSYHLAPTFSILLQCWLQQILSQGRPCHIKVPCVFLYFEDN